MKHIYIIAFLLLTIGVSAQKADGQEVVFFPKGLYDNFESLMAGSPNSSYEEAIVNVHQRGSASLKRYGGNEFYLYSSDLGLSKKKLKTKFYAYSSGNDLYINGLGYKLQYYYFKVLDDGKYLVFRAGIPTNLEDNSKQHQMARNKSGINDALLGPVMSAMRFIYIMDKETQAITVVDEEKLLELLSDYPRLLERYRRESTTPDFKTIKRYTIEYNQLAKGDTSN